MVFACFSTRLHITHYILHDKMAHSPLNLQLNEQEWLCRKTVSLRWCVLTVPEVLYLCHAGERCMTVREDARVSSAKRRHLVSLYVGSFAEVI